MFQSRPSGIFVYYEKVDAAVAEAPVAFQSRPSGIFVYYSIQSLLLWIEECVKVSIPSKRDFYLLHPKIDDLSINWNVTIHFNHVQAGFLFITSFVRRVSFQSGTLFQSRPSGIFIYYLSVIVISWPILGYVFQSRPSGIFIYYVPSTLEGIFLNLRFNPVQAGFLFITFIGEFFFKFDKFCFNPVQAGFLFITLVAFGGSIVALIWFQSRPSGIFIYYQGEGVELARKVVTRFNPVQAGFLFITNGISRLN